ncbi:uncharacterized protein LOC110107679 isoform X2 [Dendrobium catenatum]|uniref:uncharacterized protein LOC110107679 isoform X2 n=1 Tax=Dendrobium catenatum TaxID=906689 RepID=UPI0009F71AFF|nr:uncharacterized protein LOC110107679 isoform X2 [Dendrobium catenatum]
MRRRGGRWPWACVRLGEEIGGIGCREVELRWHRRVTGEEELEDFGRRNRRSIEGSELLRSAQWSSYQRSGASAPFRSIFKDPNGSGIEGSTQDFCRNPETAPDVQWYCGIFAEFTGFRREIFLMGFGPFHYLPLGCLVFHAYYSLLEFLLFPMQLAI